jgi:hypothetical protein
MSKNYPRIEMSSRLAVFQCINHIIFGFGDEVNEDLGIDICAVVFDGEVEMGAGGAAGVAGESDCVARADFGTDGYEAASKVTIADGE